MGKVFKARDPHLDRLVAIKLISEKRRSDEASRTRFLQEARAASALNHPNIITVYEIGEQDGQTFIAMELVNGKPLSEVIPAKGMRLSDVLRIGEQIAEALSAAHASRIVHRDLKPANIMVDSNGRVKVLDFGLAKLLRSAPTFDSDGPTLTMSGQPLSDDGAIIGSAPYMSPEQAEGRPVDARSDIFSFGAVLYEMVTGQRAFRGESTISTLAAVVERDPPSIREINASIPVEVERLVGRCLRKDIDRRSQNMTDVRLALEEIRADSESGRLSTVAVARNPSRRLWMRFASGCIVFTLATVGVIWFYRTNENRQPGLATMLRVSPDDGHSYHLPAISPDGAFVAFVSDRSGKNQLWLQQVGSGSPIQLTHSDDDVAFPAFFPDGKHIVYTSGSSEERRGKIEVISPLGGDARTAAEGGYMMNWASPISPDGRKLAFYEDRGDGVRLITVSSEGGEPLELKEFNRIKAPYYGRAAWTPDSRNLICYGLNRGESTEAMDWFVVPVDGSAARSAGALEQFAKYGLKVGSLPMVITRNRALFVPDNEWDSDLWGVTVTPGSWRVEGRPSRITSGTQDYTPYSADSSGVVATEVSNKSMDLFLLPLSPTTGEPTAPVQRLTRDNRSKFVGIVKGGSGKAYFMLSQENEFRVWELDTITKKQRLAFSGIPLSAGYLRISPDGRQIAYGNKSGKSLQLVVAGSDAKLQNARMVCDGCIPYQFSPDGRFILYGPVNTAQKSASKAIRLVDLATDKNRSWIESQSEPIRVIDQVSGGSDWITLSVQATGSSGPERHYLVPWSKEAAPKSEWVEISLGGKNGQHGQSYPSLKNNFYYAFQGSKLMLKPFDAQKRHFGELRELTVPAGPEPSPKPGDGIQIFDGGLVFTRDIDSNSEVWLMKLPR